MLSVSGNSSYTNNADINSLIVKDSVFVSCFKVKDSESKSYVEFENVHSNV
jgi:hypothetical protein